MKERHVMQQHAIILTKDNADTVAAGLNDYTAAELLEEYDWMLNTHRTLVLCKDVLPTDYSLISYVVTVSMFEANTMPVSNLNDKTYTFIRTI